MPAGRRIAPSDESEAASVLGLADQVRALDAAEEAAAIRRVTALSDVARGWVTAHAQDVRAELASRLLAIDRVGLLPPLFTLMGCSSRELPYNRMLTWIMDPTAPHRSGRLVLRELAEQLAFDALVTDLEEPEAPVELRADRRFPGARGRRKPDLLVLTKRASLLIESKVRQGETSERQYRDYARELRLVAARRGGECAAWLLAPEARDVPGAASDWKWDGAITHGELGTLFLRVADHKDITPWGRVATMLVAQQFAGHQVSEEILSLARSLVHATESRRPTFREAAHMARLLGIVPHPQTPANGAKTHDPASG